MNQLTKTKKTIPCTEYAHSDKINATVFKYSDMLCCTICTIKTGLTYSQPCQSDVKGRTIYGNFKITMYSDDSC